MPKRPNFGDATPEVSGGRWSSFRLDSGLTVTAAFRIASAQVPSDSI